MNLIIKSMESVCKMQLKIFIGSFKIKTINLLLILYFEIGSRELIIFLYVSVEFADEV